MVLFCLNSWNSDDLWGDIFKTARENRYHYVNQYFSILFVRSFQYELLVPRISE